MLWVMVLVANHLLALDLFEMFGNKSKCLLWNLSKQEFPHYTG
jgi:hypothetical protein